MNIRKIIEVEFKIIINNSLYKKNIIDEITFSKVNEKLLKTLKLLKTTDIKGGIFCPTMK